MEKLTIITYDADEYIRTSLQRCFIIYDVCKLSNK